MSTDTQTEDATKLFAIGASVGRVLAAATILEQVIINAELLHSGALRWPWSSRRDEMLVTSWPRLYSTCQRVRRAADAMTKASASGEATGLELYDSLWQMRDEVHWMRHEHLDVTQSIALGNLDGWGVQAEEMLAEALGIEVRPHRGEHQVLVHHDEHKAPLPHGDEKGMSNFSSSIVGVGRPLDLPIAGRPLDTSIPEGRIPTRGDEEGVPQGDEAHTRVYGRIGGYSSPRDFGSLRSGRII